jgi:lambda repressor-like predicted transcriptional regulator
MTAWRESEFRARIEARAEEIGKSVRQVMREAGVAEDFLAKTPQSGRRIDKIEAIAAALEWSVADILGIPVAAPPAAVDGRELRRALETAELIVGASLPPGAERAAAVADIAARVYSVLIARNRAGSPVEDLSLVADLFRAADPGRYDRS